MMLGELRLAPELRNGIVADVLDWFLKCSTASGRDLPPWSERIDIPRRWSDFASCVRSASYRTPYGDIGDYMERYWFLPEVFGERARLHRTRRSDRGRDLHDHPWHYASIVLDGGYIEEIELPDGRHERRRFRAGDVLFRHAEHRHRLDIEETVVDCWTLVFTSQNVREWGFWTPAGFVPWRDYDQLEPT